MIGDLLTLLANNLGISLADLILIGTTMGSFLFFAVEFRIGVVILFFLWATELVIFGVTGMPTTSVVILSLAGFVLLVLSLYISVSKNRQSVF